MKPTSKAPIYWHWHYCRPKSPHLAAISATSPGRYFSHLLEKRKITLKLVEVTLKQHTSNQLLNVTYISFLSEKTLFQVPSAAA